MRPNCGWSDFAWRRTLGHVRKRTLLLQKTHRSTVSAGFLGGGGEAEGREFGSVGGIFPLEKLEQSTLPVAMIGLMSKKERKTVTLSVSRSDVVHLSSLDLLADTFA